MTRFGEHNFDPHATDHDNDPFANDPEVRKFTDDHIHSIQRHAAFRALRESQERGAASAQTQEHSRELSRKERRKLGLL